MIKKALRFALIISEEPREIKKHVEYYMGTLGYDPRYKFKWKAVSGNYGQTLSGIFEYAGQRYYFNKMSDELHLEKI